ncbi:MAG: UpxY family transcription antiterminator [Coprobacter sp.]|nr:UpxY family transcription antiterminator [Coprobacter sp.]
MALKGDDTTVHWFVMRDLKRSNALLPAYKMLSEQGFEVFTPMKWVLTTRQGKRERKRVPVMQDLLFVHDKRQHIDPIERKTPTLQYRFLRNGYCEPMTVRDSDMERFIYAIHHAESVKYYRPEEITPAMHRRRIRIVGGPLDNYEGTLATVRGSKVKRLLVELPGWIAAAVEVNPDYIQLL